MNPTRWALVVCVATALAVAIPVLAATPSSGSVSATSPTVSWTGQLTGEGSGLGLAGIWVAGGTDGVCPPEPACSAFPLDVVHAGTQLQVSAASQGGSDYVYIEIEDPSGTITPGDEPAESVSVSLTNPVAGAYIVRVLGSPLPGPTMTYNAQAVLTGAVEPTPTPTPSPTPTATPTATPDGHADRDADGHADRDADGHADRDADGHADRPTPTRRRRRPRRRRRRRPRPPRPHPRPK